MVSVGIMRWVMSLKGPVGMGMLPHSLKITARMKEKSLINHHLSQPWEQKSKWRMTSRVMKRSLRMTSTLSPARLLGVVPSVSASNYHRPSRQTIIRIRTESKIERLTQIKLEGMMSLWRPRLSQFKRTIINKALLQRWGSFTNPSCPCQTCLSICRKSLKWECSRSIWLSSIKHIFSATSMVKITIHLILTQCAFCNMLIVTESKTILRMTLRLFPSILGCKKAEITTLHLKGMVSEVAKLPPLRDTALNLRQQSSCQP